MGWNVELIPTLVPPFLPLLCKTSLLRFLVTQGETLRTFKMLPVLPIILAFLSLLAKSYNVSEVV